MTLGRWYDKACAGGGAFAAVALAGLPALAQPTAEELQRQLEQRDVVIEQLLRRVDALERRAGTAPPGAVAPGQPGAATRPSTGRAPSPSTTSTPAEEEATIARALERSLVQQGGLLLPPFSFEFVPEILYTLQTRDQLAIVAPGVIPGGGTAITQQRSRRDLLEFGATFRVGLPWESQAEIRVPYAIDWNETTFGGGVAKTSRNTADFGDVEIGLSKQLLHERGWLPDLLGSVRWKTQTGRSDQAAAVQSTGAFSGSGAGTGFDAVQGALTAVKRQDPLVFVGTLSYTANLSDTIGGVDTDPGDAIGIRLGTILAASADTSLRFAIDTSFVERTAVAGRRVPGSDQVVSTLEVGIGSVLSPRIFLDVFAGIGLTTDSPDFRVGVSLPIRF
jgi:hypothetical protein